MRRWVLLVPIAALLILGGYFGLGAALGSDLCSATEIQRLTAPDGRRDAVVYEYSCGATTGFSTHVSIVDARAPLPDSAGNILSADDNSGRAALGSGGVVAVALEWLGSDSLVVALDPNARRFHQAAHVANVHIVHRAFVRRGA